MMTGMIETPLILEEETDAEETLATPWKVIVHNDPVNLMHYVTMILMRIFGYQRQKAERHMMEIHNLGKSVVWSGEREKAEFYVQQLHEVLLQATLERDT